MNKSIDCNSASSVASFIGNMLGRCFVGDTEVVLGFAPTQLPTSNQEASGGLGSITQNTFIGLGVGTLVLGSVHFAILDLKRRKDDRERERDDLFNEDRLNDLTNKETEPLPMLNESQFDKLCDQLFASEADPLVTIEPTENSKPAMPGSRCLNSDTSVGAAVTVKKQVIRRATKSNCRPQSTRSVNASPPNRSWTWLAPWALVALLCFGAAYFTGPGKYVAAPSTSTASAAKSRSTSDPAKYVTQKIRDLQVGTWVLADNPETDGIEGIDYSDINPDDFRILKVTIEKPDGGTLSIEMLHSLSWMEARTAYTGRKIELEYNALGIHGEGEVIGVSRCPRIPHRPSPSHCLVTSKFTHDAGNVIDLQVQGLSSPLAVTDNHPFWAVDHDAFVPASELTVGDRLLTADGQQPAVIGKQKRTSIEPVYNLEVDGEHVYFVGEDGILVHNAYDCTAKYSVYLGTNRKGALDWVGISKNLATREAAHKLEKRTIESVVDNAGYRQARALEHTLLHELEKKGYKLANTQQGIGPKSMHKYTEAQWEWAKEQAKRIIEEWGL